ncbi:quaternary ammonium compound efflux SMR transporter SugE [Paenibacillus mesophilus]|uniref:quaternary ammonium compound efflux SMR transporter SugE n=1 Tax=Paenibacillus mesophilus TaxID=2582849 RepID=UPI00110E5515|nr:quaternary ammonium compound efflux SMR transporter SugE [Paenibacillus mesophilus]TMV47586.1 quaternary ammonium compound efflux SMR transporter SugE [Paenibacillus mesophilus]
MAWVYLVVAGLFEMVWALGLKYSNGFTRLVPSAITVAGMIVSFFLLSLSLKTLPIGTAYAIWTGIGALGTVVVGMIFFGEPRDWARMLFLLLLLSGIVGLKVTSGPQ